MADLRALNAVAPPAAAVPSERDDRFDLLRGLFVFLMIVGHLGWRSLSPHFNLGWATAAEGFFFVSGATLGLVALRFVETGRAPRLRRRLALRGPWLYGLNLALVVAAIGLEVGPRFAGRSLSSPRRLLSFDQPLVLDVLPRYALFLLVAPLALLLLERARTPARPRAGAAILAGAALTLWAANGLLDGRLLVPFLETPRAQFAAASWQLLFFGGLALGFAFRAGRPRDREPRWLRPALMALALALVLACVWAEARAPGTANSTRGPLAPWVARPTLGPLRLANFVAAATLCWLAVDRWRAPIVRWAGGVLLPLGRNALPAFALHLPLVWLSVSYRHPRGWGSARIAAAVALALLISQVVRWPRLRKLLLPF